MERKRHRSRRRSRGDAPVPAICTEIPPPPLAADSRIPASQEDASSLPCLSMPDRPQSRPQSANFGAPKPLDGCPKIPGTLDCRALVRPGASSGSRTPGRQTSLARRTSPGVRCSGACALEARTFSSGTPETFNSTTRTQCLSEEESSGHIRFSQRNTSKYSWLRSAEHASAFASLPRLPPLQPRLPEGCSPLPELGAEAVPALAPLPLGKPATPSTRASTASGPGQVLNFSASHVVAPIALTVEPPTELPPLLHHDSWARPPEATILEATIGSHTLAPCPPHLCSPQLAPALTLPVTTAPLPGIPSGDGADGRVVIHEVVNCRSSFGPDASAAAERVRKLLATPKAAAPTRRAERTFEL